MPKALATLPQKPIVGAVRDPVVYETYAGSPTASIEDNLVRDYWRSIPVDVALAFMELLPIEDVFRAAHVCSRWYTAAISHPPLWTRLEVRATRVPRSYAIVGGEHPDSTKTDSDEWEEDELGDEDYVTISNIHLLQQLFPRAQTRPLTLTVTVPEPSTASFAHHLRRFLQLVAPQLEALHVHGFSPKLVLRLLGSKDWAFPMLFRLVCSSRNPGAASSPRVDLRRISCPALAHLDLGTHLQAAHNIARPALTYLRTHVSRLEHVLSLLLAAPTVTRLGLAMRISELGPAAGSAATRLAVFAALNTLQELCVRTQNDARRVDGVLALFQRLQCPRLVLELSDGISGRPFCPVLSGRWVDTVQVELRGAPDALEIVVTDATQRTLTIRLLCDADHRQPLDWTRVPRLHALTTLRVDASVWSLAMRNFPRAPQLAETTLVVDGASSLDAVIEYSLGAMDRGVCSKKMAIVIGGAQLSVDAELKDGLSSDVPPVPRGSSLTLSSDRPVTITKWGVDDVKKRLGVKRVVLDGVSMGPHRSI